MGCLGIYSDGSFDGFAAESFSSFGTWRGSTSLTEVTIKADSKTGSTRPSPRLIIGSNIVYFGDVDWQLA